MKTARIILLILIYCNISSCSKKDYRNQDYLLPLKIESISEISDDPEIVDFVFKTLNEVNEYSDNIERVANSNKDIIEISKDSLTVLEGLEVTKVMIEFYSNCTGIQSSVDNLDDFIKEQNSSGTLAQVESEELMAVSEMCKNRIEELSKKYKTLYER